MPVQYVENYSCKSLVTVCTFITHAGSSHRSTIFTAVCLSICLCFSYDNSKTKAVRITKLYIEMFHHESWKPIYFGVKGKGHEVQKTFLLFFRQDTVLPMAAYVSHRRVFSAAMPCRTSHVSDTGFTPHHVQHTSHGFFLAYSFSQLARGKNIAGVGHVTLVSAGFF